MGKLFLFQNQEMRPNLNDFTADDLSGVIDNYILNGAIHESEFSSHWEAVLRANIKFPFEAQFSSRKETVELRVLSFRRFKIDKEAELVIDVNALVRARNEMKKYKLEKLQHIDADIWTENYIKAWKFWKEKY